MRKHGCLINIALFILAIIIAVPINEKLLIPEFIAILILDIVYYIKITTEEKNEKYEKLYTYDAELSGRLKHVSGLPLASGVYVDMYFGKDKITFNKDAQDITIATNKITSIDIVTGKDVKSEQASGAIAGSLVYGGATGALIGSLAATSLYLTISYTSDGVNKYIIFDTETHRKFASKVEKRFKEIAPQTKSLIEL